MRTTTILNKEDSSSILANLSKQFEALDLEAEVLKKHTDQINALSTKINRTNRTNRIKGGAPETITIDFAISCKEINDALTQLQTTLKQYQNKKNQETENKLAQEKFAKFFADKKIEPPKKSPSLFNFFSCCETPPVERRHPQVSSTLKLTK